MSPRPAGPSVIPVRLHEPPPAGFRPAGSDRVFWLFGWPFLMIVHISRRSRRRCRAISKQMRHWSLMRTACLHAGQRAVSLQRFGAGLPGWRAQIVRRAGRVQQQQFPSRLTLDGAGTAARPRRRTGVPWPRLSTSGSARAIYSGLRRRATQRKGSLRRKSSFLNKFLDSVTLQGSLAFRHISENVSARFPVPPLALAASEIASASAGWPAPDRSRATLGGAGSVGRGALQAVLEARGRRASRGGRASQFHAVSPGASSAQTPHPGARAQSRALAGRRAQTLPALACRRSTLARAARQRGAAARRPSRSSPSRPRSRRAPDQRLPPRPGQGLGAAQR